MSNNSSSQESTESDSENSIELNVNLDALQKSTFNVFHVQCTSIQEFSKGGFHKKTESEIAAIEYIRLNTNIPVFKIYYWNSSVNNPVGAEYILMEHLP
ncbi:4521_t:CDS:2, partial [Racocetra persica]